MLCETLQKVNAECNDEYGRMAGGYLAQMDRFSTYLGLKHLIFCASEQVYITLQVSITLQGKDMTLQEAITAADLAVHFLERQRTDDKFHWYYEEVVKCSKDLTASPFLPRQKTSTKAPG